MLRVRQSGEGEIPLALPLTQKIACRFVCGRNENMNTSGVGQI